MLTPRSHIAIQRGVYYFRRKLPTSHIGALRSPWVPRGSVKLGTWLDLLIAPSKNSSTALVHTVTTTPANAADITEAANLLHGQEVRAFGDAGYTANTAQIITQFALSNLWMARNALLSNTGQLRLTTAQKGKSNQKRANTSEKPGKRSKIDSIEYTKIQGPKKLTASCPVAGIHGAAQTFHRNSRKPGRAANPSDMHSGPRQEWHVIRHG